MRSADGRRSSIARSTPSQATVSEFPDHDDMIETMACDVSRADEVESAIAAAESSGGPVTGLVNSAGIGRRAAAAELTDETWAEVIDVNLGGTFRMCRAVGGRLIAASIPGSIVNISSIAGQVGLRTGNANYAASKGGVDALTRTLAIEWAASASASTPSPRRTSDAAGERAISEDPSRLDYFLGNIPLGRLGRPSDVVGSVVFLLSEASAMITGHVLNVDGGHSVA